MNQVKFHVVHYGNDFETSVPTTNAMRILSRGGIQPAGAGAGANRPPAGRQPNPGRQNPQPDAAANAGEIRCYNCSRHGHYKAICPYELRPTGVCYKCLQPGHISNACHNRKRVQRLLNEVAAIQPGGGNKPIDYDDADNVAEGLASVNMVSAAFRDHLKWYTGFTNFVSHFDTGSPHSFVKRSALPYSISDETTPTNLRGLGGIRALKTHGTIICNVRFNRQLHPMKLIILPDDATEMPNYLHSIMKRKKPKQKNALVY